ncbi:TPA: hypothetical protein MEE01_005666 [Klebsiella pneumoniae]|nr:hypothetical protein [Klebsiella pneumoniae]
MTKKEFLSFISQQKSTGAVRFSLGFGTTGEIILYWTNEEGFRVWRVLSGNRGNKPSQANKDRMSKLRRWLQDAREGMEGDNQPGK